MPRKKDPAVETLDRALKRRTVEGSHSLYEKLEGEKVRCYSCGHRCIIPAGFDGICRVRHNQDGTLYVPHGYVAGLQVDPIEKKPFFHAFPGAVALSFGMLGCDYHCGYCFAPGTRVLTSRGHLRIEELFAAAAASTACIPTTVSVAPPYAFANVGSGSTEEVCEADFSERVLAGPPGLQASSHIGRSRPVVRVFRHQFRGLLVRIRPACLPEISVTPDHPILVVRGAPTSRARVGGMKGGHVPLVFVPAGEIAKDDLLAVPRRHEFSEAITIRTSDHLAPFATSFTTRHRIGRGRLKRILSLTRSGHSSREIGARMGLGPSHVRHLRSKLARDAWSFDTLEEKPARVIEQTGRVRFSKEHAPGVPATLPLDEPFARILGLYCAEGSVARAADRRHAATLVFSFGRHEEALAVEAARLIQSILGLRSRRVLRTTTLAVEVGKASAALLFQSLAGTGSRDKRVPEMLFRAHAPIVEEFLRGYADGDGYRAPNGTVTISTVSAELAAGVAGLLIKLGILPQWYSYRQPTRRLIQGRPVRQAGTVHVVRWHPERKRSSNVLETSEYFLLPIRAIGTREYEGPVYNLETDVDHTYLAGGVAVHNCQNWLTSQALRDSEALEPPRDIGPEELVGIARERRAPVMVSTYNEPLITSEWAVEVFSRAKQEGITCGYVSNGNGTPEVLRYIRPYVDLYKVDLKAFRDAPYRSLGGTLQNVVETIKNLHEMGFWVEIVTLLVPGFNDSEDELRDMTAFLASVSPDIPWHVTAFHQDYKMTENGNTTAQDLIRAALIGQAAGLRYVYAGNLPGRVGDLENTRCPSCRTLLIERYGYRVLQYRIHGDGSCPSCGTPIAGFWQSEWKVPEKDGGLRGRWPRPVPIPAARIFS